MSFICILLYFINFLEGSEVAVNSNFNCIILLYEKISVRPIVINLTFIVVRSCKALLITDNYHISNKKHV